MEMGFDKNEGDELKQKVYEIGNSDYDIEFST